MDNIPQLSTKSQLISIAKILFIIALVGLIIWLATYIFQTRRLTSTPENIRLIQTKQLAEANIRWGGIRQGITGLSVASEKIPTDQRLLINTNVLGARVTGYVGPYKSGVFDEDSATRLALSTGSRCLVLEIDYEQRYPMTPLLVYRDAWGFKQSLNTGSILKVAKSIAGRAFSPSNDSVPPAIASDPLLVVLYFVRTPNPATQPRDYIRFLGKVAEQLQPITNLCLGQTPQGDFRRQALESQLFFTPLSVLSNRIICLSNVDTSPFRRLSALGMAGEIGAKQDLDRLVHVRLYSRESPSGLGATSSPTSSQSPAAVITTPNYWLTIPPDRFADAVSNTKQAWTLVMPSTADQFNLDAKQIKQLLETYGVHCIPITFFDTAQVTDRFTGRNAPYAKTAWTYKPSLIRFIPPKPIVIQKANPLTNSGGGAVVAPKF